VERFAAGRRIAKDAFDRLHAEYEDDIRSFVDQSEKVSIDFGERLKLGLTILCNQELRLIQQAFEAGLIGPRVTRLLRSHGERLADAARVSGRDGYEASNEQQVHAYRAFRMAVAVSPLGHRPIAPRPAGTPADLVAGDGGQSQGPDQIQG
jgi:hypothetical protein